MQIRPLTALLAGLALLGAATFTAAQIERLDLPQMVQKADAAVFGTIVHKEVIVFDHPIDGPDLFFTHVTIQGHDLATNAEKTVVLTFAGGFVDDVRGVYNSEAPPADRVQVGQQVVAFYAYTDNMGGELAANAVYAAHGGIYQTVTGRGGQVVVLGQGDGYAVAQNVPLAVLQENVAVLAQAAGKIQPK